MDAICRGGGSVTEPKVVVAHREQLWWLLAERQQVKLHPGREIPRPLREVGPAKHRCRADRRQIASMAPPWYRGSVAQACNRDGSHVEAALAARPQRFTQQLTTRTRDHQHGTWQAGLDGNRSTSRNPR